MGECQVARGRQMEDHYYLVLPIPGIPIGDGFGLFTAWIGVEQLKGVLSHKHIDDISMTITAFGQLARGTIIADYLP